MVARCHITVSRTDLGSQPSLEAGGRRHHGDVSGRSHGTDAPWASSLEPLQDHDTRLYQDDVTYLALLELQDGLLHLR